MNLQSKTEDFKLSKEKIKMKTKQNTFTYKDSRIRITLEFFKVTLTLEFGYYGKIA